jgi:hypothetical protein
MARNSLYPGFVKVYYQSAGHPHVMTLPCKPFLGIDGRWWLEQKQGGAGDSFENLVTPFVTALKPSLHTASSILSAELYSMATPTSEPQWRESVSINTAGTNATAATPYAQQTITFRSANGGIFRLVIMEGGGITVNGEAFPPFAGNTGTIATYLMGNSSWICARDGGWLIAGVRSLTKTNDALRKKYLLDA